MSVHLPKKKIELKTDAVSNKGSESKESRKPVKEMKSGDAAVVYKDKNHRIKKELSFSRSKGSKGMA